MKNSILITLAVFSASFLNAQDAEKWKIGFKLNPNISWIKPDNKSMTQEGNVFRFGFSLNADKHFTDNYALGLGVNVSRTGGELTYLRKTNEVPNNGINPVSHISMVTRTYSLQYVEIPLTLKLRTNEIGYITYWGQFGLGLGINIRAKGDDVIDYKYENTNDANAPWKESDLASLTVEDEDIKDDINLFRTSLIIGGGIEYSLSGTTAIIAGITYNNGFSNSLNNKGVLTDDRDAVVYEGTGSSKKPKEYELKGMVNYFELNIGILF